MLQQPESDGSRSGSSLSLRNIAGNDAAAGSGAGGNSSIQSPTHRGVHRSISASSTKPSRRASSGAETLRKYRLVVSMPNASTKNTTNHQNHQNYIRISLYNNILYLFDTTITIIRNEIHTSFFLRTTIGLRSSKRLPPIYICSIENELFFNFYCLLSSSFCCVLVLTIHWYLWICNFIEIWFDPFSVA